MTLMGAPHCLRAIVGVLPATGKSHGWEILLNVLRGGYAQFDRIVKLDTPLGNDWLVPLYVKINARLGRNFEVTVDASSVVGDKIKLNALMLQPVTLWIRQTDGAYLPIHGYVQQVRRLGSDGALSYFQLRFASWLSFLKLSSDRRDWQEAGGWQILADVFDKHPQSNGQYRSELRGAIRSYSHRVQWETDWNFVHRSMEEVGVFARFDFAKDGKSHQVVVMDDLYFGPSLPKPEMKFSRAGAEEDCQYDNQCNCGRLEGFPAEHLERERAGRGFPRRVAHRRSGQEQCKGREGAALVLRDDRHQGWRHT